MDARRCGERGSALIIVFVFAAVIAIMLYMEMPVAAFEAKRNKEQLLVDRGNEYAHAVKLFVRKFGMYPNSVDQLENTNRMRFLRHKFKDPLTGKDDWRPLHAGPGGQLIDSKVNPIGNPLTGNSSGNGSFGSSTNSASSGFGNSGSGSFGSNNAPPEVVVAPLPQRPPAVSSSGSGGGEVPSASQADQNPTTPLLSPDQAPMPGQANGPASAGQPGVGQPGAVQAGTGTEATNPMQAVRGLLNNPNAATPQAGPGGSTMGAITSGGFAGVASKAAGHSIKTVNDQSDYSLWEFFYDPTKDPMRGAMGAGQPGAPGAGQNPGFGQTPGSQTSPAAGMNTASPTTAPTAPTTPPQNPQQ